MNTTTVDPADKDAPPPPIEVNTAGCEHCYDDVCSLAERHCNIADFAEGRYAPGDKDTYEGYIAALNQKAEFMLDQVMCFDNRSTLLEIGCGYGRILKIAKARGVSSTGITIIPHQVKRCLEDGLSVYLQNYRHIPQEWNGRFTGIILNGPIEHFVPMETAMAGRTDDVYREMFSVCGRILQPRCRVATATIHIRAAAPDPRHILEGRHTPGSFEERCQTLNANLHGWYPVRGQFEKCAKGLFRLVSEEDGTDDYRRTSEFWSRLLKKGVTRNPRFWPRVAKAFIFRDSLWKMIKCMEAGGAWPWQFMPGPNGDPPPMVLLRQTWERVD